MRTCGLGQLEAALLITAGEQQAKIQGLDRFMQAYWEVAEGWIADQPRASRPLGER